jgi:hypothetical protein
LKIIDDIISNLELMTNAANLIKNNSLRESINNVLRSLKKDLNANKIEFCVLCGYLQMLNAFHANTIELEDKEHILNIRNIIYLILES